MKSYQLQIGGGAGLPRFTHEFEQLDDTYSTRWAESIVKLICNGRFFEFNLYCLEPNGDGRHVASFKHETNVWTTLHQTKMEERV